MTLSPTFEIMLMPRAPLFWTMLSRLCIRVIHAIPENARRIGPRKLDSCFISTEGSNSHFFPGDLKASALFPQNCGPFLSVAQCGALHTSAVNRCLYRRLSSSQITIWISWIIRSFPAVSGIWRLPNMVIWSFYVSCFPCAMVLLITSVEILALTCRLEIGKFFHRRPCKPVFMITGSVISPRFWV